MGYRYILLTVLVCLNSAWAESNRVWSEVSSVVQAKAVSSIATKPLSLLPDSYRLYRLDENVMRSELALSSKSKGFQKQANNYPLEIPLPSGDFFQLKLVEGSIMSSKLASKYPGIKTYRVDADDSLSQDQNTYTNSI